jgi:hypothetical protein
VRLEDHLDQARAVLDGLKTAGIDLDAVPRHPALTSGGADIGRR